MLMHRTGRPRYLLGALLMAACSGPPKPLEPGGIPHAPPGPARPAGVADGGALPGSRDGGAADPLQSRPDLPPEQRALVFVDGQERIVDAGAIAAAGYTLVDLRDDWTPFIFQTLKSERGESAPNRYRRIFVGLANDQLDADGQPLESTDKNYLELFGIPPSLSVLAARFLEDEKRPCEAVLPLAAIEKVKSLKVGSSKGPARFAEAERAAFAAAELRLACEGLLLKRHRTGVFDDALRESLLRFTHKHMIYEAPYFRPRTMAHLARRMLENDYQSLRRVITERTVAAAGILEDGSAGEKSPNLVEDFAREALKQLSLNTPEEALQFFKRHPAAEFRWLRVAVRLPPRPPYYGPHMELSVVVDRGDVYYDPPFDAKGRERPQPRENYPSLTLFTQHEGRKIPLVRWRTTIGGWRSEQAPDGYEYFRYKGSDVGPRVIRQVISGPVWIAPETTPIRTLVKGRTVNRAWQSVVNYDEIGPGFRSAYGLVAGYFVEPGQNGRPDGDNGIRAHGSAEYLSIGAGGFSHGCHRLLNHLAVRLYSFVLSHRNMHIVGDQSFNYARSFLYKDDVYELRIPSKGFVFLLDPPMPVNVLQGRIRGERKTPYTAYVPKPGVVYPGPPPAVRGGPEDRSGAGGAP